MQTTTQASAAPRPAANQSPRPTLDDIRRQLGWGLVQPSQR